MAEEKRKEGVQYEATGQKKVHKEYDQSDVQVLFRRGHWNSWGEAIHWLQTEGEKDNELTPGEVIHMVQDLRAIESRGEPFTNDPRRVYEMMQQHGTSHR